MKISTITDLFDLSAHYIAIVVVVKCFSACPWNLEAMMYCVCHQVSKRSHRIPIMLKIPVVTYCVGMLVDNINHIVDVYVSFSNSLLVKE